LWISETRRGTKIMNMRVRGFVQETSVVGCPNITLVKVRVIASRLPVGLLEADGSDERGID
jgi:hypothetical protein